MKTRLAVGFCFALAALVAQEPVPVSTTPAPDAMVAQPLLNEEQLDQLLGPIALYPDALIALILPAATEPVDLVLASRYLKDGGDPVTAESRAWDESVKALAHYPDVIKWMDDNLPWTRQLGEAFRSQPAEVMKSIQRLRTKARANGALADTPQQIVVPEDDYIRIVPTQPDVIFVPRYEPALVFVDRPVYYGTPFLTFGIGYRVGSWLSFDCDWHHRQVWVADHRWNWRDNRDWRHPVFPGQPGYVNQPARHPWKPLDVAPRTPTMPQRVWRNDVAQPVTVATAQVVTPPTSRENRFHGNRTDGRDAPPPLNATTVVSGSYNQTPTTTPAPQPATNFRPAHDGRRDNGNDSRSHVVTNPAPASVYGPPAPAASTQIAPAWHPSPAPAGPPAFTQQPAAPTMHMPAPAYTPVHTPPPPAPAPAPAPQQPAPRDDRDGKNKQAN